jgi:hypothetical protein
MKPKIKQISLTLVYVIFHILTKSCFFNLLKAIFIRLLNLMKI